MYTDDLNSELHNTQYDEAQLKQQLTSLRASAMNILAAREHSIAELRVKLKRKNERSSNNDVYKDYIEQWIEIILQQLIADNLLNEARFTESFVRFRINKGSGPVKIRHELSKRGISSELINDALESSYNFWQEHIEKVYSKRFGDNMPKDYKEQIKPSRFLYQRGFSSELIRRFFNQH